MLVLSAGYAFSNGNIVSTPAGFLASSQSPNFNPQLVFPNTVGVIPTVSINGMQNMNASIADVDHGTNHQGFGDVTKVDKNDTFISGFSYNHYQKLENNTTGTQGSFGFNTAAQFVCASGVTGPGCVPNNTNAGAGEAQAYANFLSGNANSGFSQLSRDPVTDIKSSLWEAFVQDNWKATRRLTLNVGVRYAYYRQPWDANLLLSNFEPSTYSASKAPTIATTGLICFTATCSQAGSNVGLPITSNPNANYAGINYVNGIIFNGPSSANNNQASPYGNKVGNAQKTNFAPRFGWAWDVFGNGRTSFRGGYGWAFDGAEVSFYETTVFNNPPGRDGFDRSDVLRQRGGRCDDRAQYDTWSHSGSAAALQDSEHPAVLAGYPTAGHADAHHGCRLLRRPRDTSAWRGGDPPASAGCMAGEGAAYEFRQRLHLYPPGHKPGILAQHYLRPSLEPDQAVSRLQRRRRAAHHLQLELQRASGKGHEALQRKDVHRRQLHVVA